jgi:hypothetical protein
VAGEREDARGRRGRASPLVAILVGLATHRPLTSRPLSAWVNAKLTLADSLSVSEKMVPIGCLCLLRVKTARTLLSRQIESDWRASETVGAGSRVTVSARVFEFWLP